MKSIVRNFYGEPAATIGSMMTLMGVTVATGVFIVAEPEIDDGLKGSAQSITQAQKYAAEIDRLAAMDKHLIDGENFVSTVTRFSQVNKEGFDIGTLDKDIKRQRADFNDQFYNVAYKITTDTLLSEDMTLALTTDLLKKTEAPAPTWLAHQDTPRIDAFFVQDCRLKQKPSENLADDAKAVTECSLNKSVIPTFASILAGGGIGGLSFFLGLPFASAALRRRPVKNEPADATPDAPIARPTVNTSHRFNLD